jgi:YVTN family beta-propeller protein
MADGSIEVVDLNNNSVEATIPYNGYTTQPAVNESTNMVYALSDDTSELDVIDGATNQVVDQIPLQSPGSQVVVDPTSNTIYVVEPGADVVEVIDGATKQVVQTIPIESAPSQIGINPNTHRLYVASANPNAMGTADQSILTTIDTNTGRIVTEQAFPGYPNNTGATLVVDTVSNQVTMPTESSSGGTYLFDDDGNLIRSVNNTSDLQSMQPTGTAINPATGAMYLASDTTGLKIFNQYGNEVQSMPAACASSVDVTSIP